jgi:uncharacterized protein YndB with AHSA1/START domain
MSHDDARDRASMLSQLDVNTYYFSYEMTIDSPIPNVWQHMLNYHDWNPDHVGAKVERLAGEKHQEGEVILESKRTGNGFAPPTIVETVKVIPNKKIVWALYMLGSGASQEIGFVDFSLQETEGRTQFTYQSYGWGNSAAIGHDKKAFQEAVTESLRTLLSALKAYVEERKHGSRSGSTDRSAAQTC